MCNIQIAPKTQQFGDEDVLNPGRKGQQSPSTSKYTSYTTRGYILYTRHGYKRKFSYATVQTLFSIETYDTTKKFDRWLMRLESVFKVFGVPETKKAAYLLHYMGPDAYDVLCDKLSPELPSNKTYDQLVKTMKQHYNPEPLEIAEIFRFLQRKQHEGETVQDYLTALQRLATTCNFGDYLMKALRNQFVFGLLAQNFQGRLLEEKKLTIERAVEIAVSMETSARNAAQLHHSGTGNVFNVHDKGSKGFKNQHSKTQNQRHYNNNEHKTDFKCFRCGSTKHLANACTGKNLKCTKCNQKGHLAQVCMKKKPGKSSIHSVDEILSIQDVEHVEFRNKFTLNLLVNNVSICFELDSGAAVTIINFKHFKNLFPDLQLNKTDTKLYSYNNQALKIAGFVKVQVKYKNTLHNLNLYVVHSEKQPLLGREWLRQLGLRSDAQPFYIKARKVPYPLLPKVEEELDFLQREGVLEKVDSSEYATPIVPVIKANGKIRICGAFNCTLNPNLVVDEHPLPTIEALFVSMAGGDKFTKLDLQQAYLQMEVQPEHRKYLTLSTPKGLYRSTRLMYGIASAPAIWQRTIENILKDIPGVSVFLDE